MSSRHLDLVYAKPSSWFPLEESCSFCSLPHPRKWQVLSSQLLRPQTLGSLLIIIFFICPNLLPQQMLLDFSSRYIPIWITSHDLPAITLAQNSTIIHLKYRNNILNGLPASPYKIEFILKSEARMILNLSRSPLLRSLQCFSKVLLIWGKAYTILYKSGLPWFLWCLLQIPSAFLTLIKPPWLFPVLPTSP